MGKDGNNKIRSHCLCRFAPRLFLPNEWLLLAKVHKVLSLPTNECHVAYQVIGSGVDESDPNNLPKFRVALKALVQYQ